VQVRVGVRVESREWGLIQINYYEQGGGTNKQASKGYGMAHGDRTRTQPVSGRMTLVSRLARRIGDGDGGVSPRH